MEILGVVGLFIAGGLFGSMGTIAIGWRTERIRNPFIRVPVVTGVEHESRG